MKVVPQQKGNRQVVEEKSKPEVQTTSSQMEVEDIQQEPEAGLEPAGPDQSLPTAAESNPPPERKATSYINVILFYFYFLLFLTYILKSSC